jgi:hypothetical protein
MEHMELIVQKNILVSLWSQVPCWWTGSPNPTQQEQDCVQNPPLTESAGRGQVEKAGSGDMGFANSLQTRSAFKWDKLGFCKGRDLQPPSSSFLLGYLLLISPSVGCLSWAPPSQYVLAHSYPKSRPASISSGH